MVCLKKQALKCFQLSCFLGVCKKEKIQKKFKIWKLSLLLIFVLTVQHFKVNITFYLKNVKVIFKIFFIISLVIETLSSVSDKFSLSILSSLLECPWLNQGTWSRCFTRQWRRFHMSVLWHSSICPKTTTMSCWRTTDWLILSGEPIRAPTQSFSHAELWNCLPLRDRRTVVKVCVGINIGQSVCLHIQEY